MQRIGLDAELAERRVANRIAPALPDVRNVYACKLAKLHKPATVRAGHYVLDAPHQERGTMRFIAFDPIRVRVASAYGKFTLAGVIAVEGPG